MQSDIYIVNFHLNLSKLQTNHCIPKATQQGCAGRGGATMKIRRVGRGEDENPRGGPGRGGANKRVNRLIQKFDKSA